MSSMTIYIFLTWTLRYDYRTSRLDSHTRIIVPLSSVSNLFTIPLPPPHESCLLSSMFPASTHTTLTQCNVPIMKRQVSKDR